jgi:hypothetical protein
MPAVAAMPADPAAITAAPAATAADLPPPRLGAHAGVARLHLSPHLFSLRHVADAPNLNILPPNFNILLPLPT